MRVLLVHNEDVYYAGAEKVLEYFLAGLAGTDVDVTLAVAAGSKVDASMPAALPRVRVSGSGRFSPFRLIDQARRLYQAHRQQPFDLIHGWAARDWELTGLAGALCRRPTVGTLHDHPEAVFIRPKRRRVMRGAANWGLDRVVCVSQAVADACRLCGYRAGKLAVVRNGLPPVTLPPRTDAPVPRLGFLGLISERKGLGGVFEILRELERAGGLNWELAIAGDAGDAAGRALKADLHARYGQDAWWPRVRWLGWVNDPLAFLAQVDLLICASTEFDPLPTVLIEAGHARAAVLAADVGGVREIVADGQTGWVFAPGDWRGAAARLRELLREPSQLGMAGQAGWERAQRVFSVEIMVAEYREVYSTLARHG